MIVKKIKKIYRINSNISSEEISGNFHHLEQFGANILELVQTDEKLEGRSNN